MSERQREGEGVCECVRREMRRVGGGRGGEGRGVLGGIRLPRNLIIGVRARRRRVGCMVRVGRSGEERVRVR